MLTEVIVNSKMQREPTFELICLNASQRCKTGDRKACGNRACIYADLWLIYLPLLLLRIELGEVNLLRSSLVVYFKNTSLYSRSKSARLDFLVSLVLSSNSLRIRRLLGSLLII